jgi:levanbiose-producing levanase
VEQYASLVRERPATRIKELAVWSTAKALDPSTKGIVQNIDVTISPRSAQRAGLIVRGSASGDLGTRIFYDTTSQTLTLDRSKSGETNFSSAFSKQHIVNLPLENGKLHLTVVVDRNSVEVFADNGRAVITDLIFPAPADNRMSVFADHGEAMFSDIVVTNLSSDKPGTRPSRWRAVTGAASAD